jgi:predicted nucleic acid-binding protein
VYDLFELYVLNDNTVIHALSLHERYGYSYYDSLIIAAAIEGECEYLFSEDLQDGQTIEGVTIQNIYTNL